MAIKNYISAELTAEQESTAMQTIDGLETQLTFLIDLDPEERKRLVTAGDRSLAFVQKALDLATASPDMLPRDFDIAEFRRDVNLAAALQRVSAEITRVHERIKTSLYAASADAYAHALEVYHRSKRTQSEGLTALTRDLSERFNRKAIRKTAAASAS